MMEFDIDNRRSVWSASFLRLWSGSTASGLATWALPFVLGLAVLDQTLSAVDLGIVLAARTTGFLLAIPVSGVLADRSGRRKVVLYASITSALGIPVIMAGLATGGISGLLLVASGAAIAGIGQGACRPAYQALVPLVIASEGLQAANAAMSISVRVTNLVGPVAATGLALLFGVPAALAAVLVLWSISAFAPAWPAEKEETISSELVRRLTATQFVQELVEGLQEARRHPWFVAGLCALTAVIATGYSVTAVMLPLISRETYGGASLLAGSATAYTLGALLGAVVMARWRPLNQGWWALAGLGLYSLVPFSLLAPAHISVPIAAFFMAGFGIELFNVPWFTATQREVAPDKLARVSSLDFVMSYGLAPLGLAALAPLAQTFGNLPVLLVSGLVCLVAPLLAIIVPSSRRFSPQPR
jgi:MFS family permease